MAENSSNFNYVPRWLATALLGALLLSGCTPKGGAEPSGNGSTTGTSTSSTPTASVAVEDDGFTTLPVYMVASQAYTQAHPDNSHTTLTCGEAMVLVNTVPVQTDEPVVTALNFLLESEQFYHGDPELMDPLKNAGEVKVDKVTTSGDTVTVNLKGTLNNPGWCQAAQMVAQLELTAAAAASGKKATVTINGTPVRDELGVAEPYAQGQDPQK